ncbi:MAG TPA: hypothetical protein VF950_27285 [Planctomycetota bacterium]
MSLLLALQTLTLRDVQGLYGGHDVWIAADGAAHVRKVDRGVEKRYAGKVPIDELKVLLAKHDLKKIKIPDRPGVPDEARPALIWRAEKDVVRVAKWAGQKDADFDAIYSWIQKKAEEIAKSKPLHDGRWDPAWKPEGFTD